MSSTSITTELSSKQVAASTQRRSLFQAAAKTSTMANVRSLSDLNGEGSDDDNKKHNDYYAGGEKRCAWQPLPRSA